MAENKGSQEKRGDLKKERKKSKTVENSSCGGALDTGKNQIKAGKITI